MTIFIHPPEPPYGKDRRAKLKQLFLNAPEGEVAMLCVNTKYRPQMKTDPDLRKLVKEGFLKQIRLPQYVSYRTHKGPFKRPGQRRTFLVLHDCKD